ncbi:MAG: heavy metal-responsive transcriptional regulator [Acidiferrobacter sp.]
MRTVTIGILAKQAGVGAGTLRYYEALGLLAPAGRSASGYRLYHRTELKRLRFIRRAQELGFSLEEIAELLKLSQQSSARAADVKRLTETKIADIDRRIQDLERMRRGLQALAGRCHGRGSVADCPILAALNADDEFAIEELS